MRTQTEEERLRNGMSKEGEKEDGGRGEEWWNGVRLDRASNKGTKQAPSKHQARQSQHHNTTSPPHTL